MKKILLLIMPVIMAISCSKKDNPPPPPELPTISSISPLSGPEGSEVNISGTYLTTATDVKFGGITATFTISGNSIKAKVPTGALSGRVSVKTPAGSASSTNDFTVVDTVPPPHIDKVLPDNNPVKWPVLITGSRMNDITKVTFGGVEAPIDTNFDGQVSTRVPESLSPGITQLTVTNKHGISNTIDFTILSAPPLGQPPPEELKFKAKAIYIPQVTNNWFNEADNNYYIHLDDPRVSNGGGTEYFGLDAFDLDIVYFDPDEKRIDVLIHRDDQGKTEKYTGTFVDSDVPNQNDPDWQRIIFWTEAGRQVMVRVKVK